MKTQLLLISLFSLILCNQPFLRKLAEVTEASCKAEGKKFQEAVPAQCKFKNVVLEVTEKKDCKKGEWKESSTKYCTATEIKTEENCKGIPEFTAGKETIKKCKLGDEEITDANLLANKDACQKALVWTEETCTITIEGKTKEECDNLKGDWEKTESSGSVTLRNRRTSDTGKCVYNEKKSSDECTKVSGQYSAASCSVAQFNTVDKCKGTPVYSEEVKGECKSGDTVITSRVTEKECKVELVWVTGTCSHEKIYTQEECESEPTFTDAVAAKCVEEEKSGSNFIKAINFVLLAICLLIL